MSNAKEPRGWWLSPRGPNFGVRREPVGNDCIHVIEKSAYDSALSLLHETEDKASRYKAERDALTAQLAEAEALIAEFETTVKSNVLAMYRGARDIERLERALAYAKDSYWYRCYDGKADKAAPTLAQFDEEIERLERGE